MSSQLVVLLHLCDSLFPTGSFSHSDGLEAATSQGRVASADDLRAWIDVALTESLGRTDGPAVARAWAAFDAASDDLLASLDDELWALRVSATGREASRAMGTRLLRTWQTLRPDVRLERLVAWRAAWTLPVAFGIAASVSAIEQRAAVEGFMYTRLASIVSAAMRLMAIGQAEGHRLLAEALGRVPALAERAMSSAQPIGAFTPALDLALMSHQYTHSRLFRS